MDLRDTNQIHGLTAGIITGQHERTDELNNRIAQRNIPGRQLEPNFAPRAVPTQCVLFPAFDQRPLSSVDRNAFPAYEQSSTFNPGSDRAPSSGYRNNIDLETVLRNQTVALQHGASQGVYVPSSKSDLYNNTIEPTYGTQPHPDLFTRPQFDQRLHANVASGEIGTDRFFNHTRTQLRNL